MKFRYMWPMLFLGFALRGQDRSAGSGPRLVYPDRMLIQNEGNIIDVTRIPEFISAYNAHPDGTDPDETTKALIDCYDYIVHHPDRRGIIYFPNGEYRINRTIVYSGPKIMRPNNHENIIQVRFRGQHREKVILRLVDHAPGFGDKEDPSNVVSFGKHHRNNAVSTNFFENITIHTGYGNPGAIGLRFHGANNEDIRNVTIRSGDGAGYIGLDLPMGACQGYYSDITVDGFDYGIHGSGELATSLSFEFLTLLNQKKAGIWIEDVSMSVRKLHCTGAPLAVKHTHRNGLLNLHDSRLEGPANSGRAIDLQDGAGKPGQLFARNVRITGYQPSVIRGNSVEVKGDIMEYVSEGPYMLFESSGTSSLALPVEPTPLIPWEADFSDWAIVNDFGANGMDQLPDAEAIQKAMDAGRSQVFFLPGEYIFDRPVRVPSGVRRINFMYSELIADGNMEGLEAQFMHSDRGAFIIEGESGDPPIILEDLRIYHRFFGHHWLVDHASRRTLVLSDMHMQRGQMYRNSVEGGRVFVENCSPRSEQHGTEGLVPFRITGQKAWLRYINPEHSRLEMWIDHSDVWLFGFKKEGWGSAFRIVNGSRFEMLGGFGSTWGWDIGSHSLSREELREIPLIIIEDSDVSISAVTLGNESEFYDIIVRETREGITRELQRTELPRKDNGHILMPLYLGNYRD